MLASIEHDQWVTWSKQIANEETISETRLKRWKKLWKPYNKLSQDNKEIDIELAEKVLDIMPIKCPIYQCGGWMKAKERKYPKGMTEDDFPNGMNGDIQTPDLVCTNCHGIYQFKGFRGKRNVGK